MNKSLIIISIVVTVIITFVVTSKILDKPQEAIKQEVDTNLFNSSTPSPTPVVKSVVTHTPKPIVQTPKPQTPIATPAQDITLKIEQCKIRAQLLAKQAAQEWFSEMIIKIPDICRNSYDEDCSLKWTNSFSDSAKNMEQSQYYPVAYSSCLNSIR